MKTIREFKSINEDYESSYMVDENLLSNISAAWKKIKQLFGSINVKSKNDELNSTMSSNVKTILQGMNSNDEQLVQQVLNTYDEYIELSVNSAADAYKEKQFGIEQIKTQLGELNEDKDAEIQDLIARSKKEIDESKDKSLFNFDEDTQKQIKVKLDLIDSTINSIKDENDKKEIIVWNKILRLKSNDIIMSEIKEQVKENSQEWQKNYDSMIENSESLTKAFEDSKEDLKSLNIESNKLKKYIKTLQEKSKDLSKTINDELDKREKEQKEDDDKLADESIKDLQTLQTDQLKKSQEAQMKEMFNSNSKDLNKTFTDIINAKSNIEKGAANELNAQKNKGSEATESTAANEGFKHLVSFLEFINEAEQAQPANNVQNQTAETGEAETGETNNADNANGQNQNNGENAEEGDTAIKPDPIAKELTDKLKTNNIIKLIYAKSSNKDLSFLDKLTAGELNVLIDELNNIEKVGWAQIEKDIPDEYKTPDSKEFIIAISRVVVFAYSMMVFDGVNNNGDISKEKNDKSIIELIAKGLVTDAELKDNYINPYVGALLQSVMGDMNTNYETYFKASGITDADKNFKTVWTQLNNIINTEGQKLKTQK